MMDKIATYRQYIQEILTEHSKLVWDKRITAETIFDLKSDRYQLIYVGWKGSHRVYGIVLHVDIIDGKIWVQQDGTEAGIANKLVDRGVDKQQIVLAFNSPTLRQYTDFATG